MAKDNILLDSEMYTRVTDEQLKEIFKPGQVVDIFEIPEQIAGCLEPDRNIGVVSVSAPALGRFLDDRFAKVFPGIDFSKLEDIPDTNRRGVRIPGTVGR